MQTPDNVIGETLVVQGRVEFSNLLRIDGHFEVIPVVAVLSDILFNLKIYHKFRTRLPTG